MVRRHDPQQAVTAFLLSHGHRPFCAGCLARAARLRSVVAVQRAMKALASGPGYRVEEADCGSCDRTTLTIRALWTGM
jgi:hypothetical protein